jgi:WD40 repeat protein
MADDGPVLARRLFLSYARGDADPLVARLYEDLTARGFFVWWDRATMPSRALTFLQEIRDAIDGVERLILVVTPHAVTSDYVTAEWGYALSTCKVVVPILAAGSYDQLPPALRGLHSPDFREFVSYPKVLPELLRILDEAVVPLGEVHEVPSLPPYFVERADEMARLSDLVLADARQPIVITGTRQTTTLQGMGGIGKSVLAAAFARACDTRRVFRDGVAWETLGTAVSQVSLLRSLGAAFGDQIEGYADVETATARLAQFLGGRACLVVLDDVWNAVEVEALVNALESRCRLLITTRDAGVATALGSQMHRLDVFSDPHAMQLLADWSGQPPQRLPPEAQLVAQECGNLPFALAVCGAMVRDGTPWSDLLGALRAADLAFLDLEQRLPNYPYPDVLRSLKVSVDALARIDPAWERHYLELVVFPANQPIPEAAIVTLWTHTNDISERDARMLLTTLGRKALLRLEGTAPSRTASLHDLQRDYLRAACPDAREAQVTLVEAYRQKAPGGWSNGPDDGYFFAWLPYHLVQADHRTELQELLFDYRWLRRKLQATDVSALIEDYGLLEGSARASTVRDVLRLAAHLLARDSTALPSQLHGRLSSHSGPEVQALLAGAANERDFPWLRPLSESLPSSGGPLIRTLTSQGSTIDSVTVTPDGLYAVLARYDAELEVFDLHTGNKKLTIPSREPHMTSGRSAVTAMPDGDRLLAISHWTLLTYRLDGTLLASLGERWGDSPLQKIAVTADGRSLVTAQGNLVWVLDPLATTPRRTLQGHSEPVAAVAVSADGRRVASGSRDATARVWDLANGAVLGVFAGHDRDVDAVAVTPDGHRLVSGSADHTLKVWDIDSGRELATLRGHTGGVNSVAVTSDGRRLVSGSDDHTLKVWDIDSGRELATLRGHTKRVRSVAVTPDGRQAVSGGEDGVMQLWSLDLAGRLSTTYHEERVRALAVSADGRRVVSGAGELGEGGNNLRLWAVDQPNESISLVGHRRGVTSLAMLPGNRVVSGSYDGTLQLWSLDEPTTPLIVGRGGDLMEGITSLAVTPQGKAVCGLLNATVRVWDLDRGQQIWARRGHADIVTSVAVTPDGRRAVSGSNDGTLVVWDLERGKGVTRLPAHEDLITAVVTTPDGRWAISGAYDQLVKVWDIEPASDGGHLARRRRRRQEQASLLHVLTGHTDDVVSLAVTPDGRNVISASSDATLIVWPLVGETSGGLAEPLVLRGHAGGVTSVAVTSDGRRCASTSWDATVRVWDVVRGELLATFAGEGPMQTCVIAPDDVTIVAGEDTGRVHLLRFEEAGSSLVGSDARKPEAGRND